LLLAIVVILTLITPVAARRDTVMVTNKGGSGVISQDTYGKLTNINYRLSDVFQAVYLRLIILKSWDGNLSGEDVISAQRSMGISFYEEEMGMIVVLDTTQGNCGIIVGDEIKDRFDDAMVEQYLEDYFRPYYDEGLYDKALTSLFDALADWYIMNDIQLTQPENTFSFNWVVIGIVVAAAVLFLTYILNLLYGFFAKAAYIKRSYVSFYRNENIGIPAFRIWYVWTKPFFDTDNRTSWSFVEEFWKESKKGYSKYEYPQNDGNGYDIAARILKAVVFVANKLLFVFVVILMLIAGFIGGGSGGSSSGSGGGGGGRSGGGGGGRR